MGARPVQYGGEAEFRQLLETERAYFQFVSPKGKDWRVEEEWRVMGDVDLRMLDAKDVIVWVMQDSEIGVIQGVSRFPVRCLIA
jgi:hypothetical protein